MSALVVERDVMVAMRDGVRLAADVYRPDDDAPHPVLMHRTPYGKAMPLYLHATGLDTIAAVERGYAVVSQDCRGRSASEGAWRPFRHEADDGHDTVEWLAGQPWCDGRVGAWGCSYMGLTALLAAVAAPPHLRAVMSYMAGPSAYRGWAYTGGAFELGFATFWSTRGAWETLRRLDAADERRAALTAALHALTARPSQIVARLPVAELAGEAAELIPFWEDWLAHPTLDDFWRAVDVPARAREIRVPVLHISGVGDNLLAGHLALNDALAEHPDEAVRETHRFVLGPWDHESYQTSRPSASGQQDFGPQARNGAAQFDPLAREWFDHWLRDAETPLLARPRASYFLTGADEWREAASWPPPHRPLALHLAAGGRLLAEPPAGEEPPDGYEHDPLDPVPNVGGRTLAPVFGPPGVQDQRGVEAREDVLVYTQEPLTAPLTVAGPVTLTLFVSSSAEDTDFTGKLVDVEPGGYCRNLAEGIVRMRHRHGGADEALLRPGEVAEVEIDLQAVAHVFAPGHAVRVEVASAAFPHFSRNLNARVRPELGTEADARVARQSVFHDAGRPSRLVLPVVSHA